MALFKAVGIALGASMGLVRRGRVSVAPVAACIVLTAGLTGCSSPARFTDKPMQRLDGDTSYRVDDTPGGFIVNVEYSKYQFIPETGVVVQAAKDAARAVAFREAAARRRSIKPIDEQRMRVGTGRTFGTAVSYCTVEATAEYVSETDTKGQ